MLVVFFQISYTKVDGKVYRDGFHPRFVIVPVLPPRSVFLFRPDEDREMNEERGKGSAVGLVVREIAEACVKNDSEFKSCLNKKSRCSKAGKLDNEK